MIPTRLPRASLPLFVFGLALPLACRSDAPGSGSAKPEAGRSVHAEPGASASEAAKRPYLLERVDDVAVVQVYADGFERLPLKEKTLAWHLYQAALAGRDIYWQQKSAYGLALRDLVEEILTHGQSVDPKTLENVRHYAKLLWVNNGPYHYPTARKFTMQGTSEQLALAAQTAEKYGARFDRDGVVGAKAFVERLTPILFDPGFEPMVTAKSPPPGVDLLQASAVTYYGPDVTLADLEGFQEHYELNSNIVRDTSGAGAAKLVEQVWRTPGFYGTEIRNIVGHLREALPFAPDATRDALLALIRFYESGERADREAYDIAWVADKDSVIDTVNGFIEVYLDPRGKKGGWEGIVSYEDPKKAKLIKTIAENAQWFEDHMPYEARFKKTEVKGISARSIDVLVETGDSGPVTPVGINLPNDQAIREKFGSKSVSLANIVEAYAESTPTSARAEFCYDDAEVRRAEKWQSLTSDLLTNMHEVIGHASGQQAQDKHGDPASFIKEYYSALEEGRADLVALYFMGDPKMKELGLLDQPEEAALAAYENYVRNGALQQLRRVREGDQIEEDHMRNRHMVARWIQANSGAVVEKKRDGKTFLVVKSAKEFREAAGRLLALVQQLKSTGDYAGTKALFDAHGIKFDPALRDEVLARYAKLDVASYTGFVMPRLEPVTDGRGKITDVKIDYPRSIERQMLEWSGRR
jgi:dipeptidyl-peptidase-3